MKPFAFLAALATAILGHVAIAQADPIPLAELSRHINSIQLAESGFKQVGPDGITQEGQLKIQRPYRMRFEYRTKDLLVLASSGQLAIYDGHGRGPQVYPLSKTPLALILEPNVDFSRAGMVFSHQEKDGRTIIHARDPAAPQRGMVQLDFLSNPTRLVSWIVVDDTGTRTHMFLDGLQRPAAGYEPSTFSLESENARRQLR